MAQLRSCYFCGTTGALSEYETLPQTVRVAEETTARATLCNQCHAKLTTVLEPLVDYIERTADEGDVRTPADADAPTTQPEVTFSSSGPVDATPPDSTSPTGDRPDDPRDSDDGGAVDDRESSAADGGRGASHAAGDEDDTGTGDDTGDEEESEAAEETDATPQSADLDRVYHKLLRFLRNREFPIPRTEAETVAQSAYDLTATEASQVVQRAVDRGVLDERDGDLHRR